MIPEEIKNKFKEVFKYVIIHPTKKNDDLIKELKDFGFEIFIHEEVPLDNFYISQYKPDKLIKTTEQ